MRTPRADRGRTWSTMDPDEVINWNYNETGGLDWAVIRTSCLQQSKVTDAEMGEGNAVDLLRPRKLPDLPQDRRRPARSN